MEALEADIVGYNPRRDDAARANGTALLLLCTLAALSNPGLLVGGGLAWIAAYRRGYPAILRWLVAISLAALAISLGSYALPAWPWRLVPNWHLDQFVPILTPLRPGAGIVASIGVEALGGPILLEVALFAVGLLGQTLTMQMFRQRREARKRVKATTGELPVPSDGEAFLAHPPGFIRLGMDSETMRHVDLYPEELAEHVFLPGASGMGKTTTLSRLTDGALRLGHGVVMVDCKGGDLGPAARMLATKYELSFHAVDPDDPESLGYDPCSGDASDVANKLIGVFNYEGAAEVYKLAAMRVLPVLVRALRAAGQPVTLDALADALSSPGALRRLGRGAGEPHLDQLDNIARQEGVVAEGHVGLSLRLGALLEGKFGPLFRPHEADRPVLDWDNALKAASVTYIALRATASSEDVELMGRIIAQDLKQVCSRRIRSVASDETLVPTLLVIDEFAALREAEQFIDLLLQARQALLPTVMSTQVIPDSTTIRKAALQAGLIISHRLETEDAQVMAAQFGTRKAWDDTVMVNKDGTVGAGRVRRVDAYSVHPNVLRTMQRGVAAVRSVRTDRRSIVQIYPVSRVSKE